MQIQQSGGKLETKPANPRVPVIQPPQFTTESKAGWNMDIGLDQVGSCFSTGAPSRDSLPDAGPGDRAAGGGGGKAGERDGGGARLLPRRLQPVYRILHSRATSSQTRTFSPCPTISRSETQENLTSGLCTTA